MLLWPAWKRLLVAGAAVAAIWAAVLWVAPSAPSTAIAERPQAVATQGTAAGPTQTGDLRVIVESGSAAPGGGHFDRFDVGSAPVAAPVNARRQVAFYATVARAAGREGIFLADAGHVAKMAAFGDSVPGGGTLAEFGERPLPALNAAGHVAFNGQIAGGRATEGVFLVGSEGLRPIALAGDDAPGVPAGVLTGFDAPALNDNDELAFVANVRRGRDTLDVLYFWNGMRLQRVVAEGERLLRIGGVMDKIGEPALNNSDVIAFPAAIFKGPALAGIFVAGARELRLVAQAGDQVSDGSLILRFAERVAIDEEGAVVFGAYLGREGSSHEGILRVSAESLAAVAIEGGLAPDGGRYVGFGPWPTVAADGAVAFIAALDGTSGPLGAFAGNSSNIRRAAIVGETLPDGRVVGRFALNAIAEAGPAGAVTFVTAAQTPEERNIIYCRCPAPNH
jgi:hypothetical protein